RVEHRSRAAPDGRVALRAGTGFNQSGAVAAERVPDVLELPAGRIEDGDVSLVGGAIADVAGRDRHQVPLIEVERRIHFLAARKQRDGGAPERVSVADGQLLDLA